MKYLELRINCIQPVKVSKSINSMVKGESISYILGSLLRGAFIYNYIKINKVKELHNDEKGKKWFFDNKLHFLNGYPEYAGERTFPMMQGIYADSADMIGFDENNIISVKNEFKDEIEDTDKKFSGGEFIYAGDDSKLMTLSTKKIYNLHIRKGSEDDKGMFRYEAIKENQSFISLIKCDIPDDEIEEVKKIIENGEYYLGGSKGSGYGKVEVEIISEKDSNPENIGEQSKKFNNGFVIYMLSDGILLDEFNNPASYISENYLKEALKLDEVIFEQSASDTVLSGGYNNKWNCRIPQYECIKAGSMFRYSYKGNLNKELLEKLMNSGIGLRKSEGYGRILIMPEFNISTIEKAQIKPLKRKSRIKIKFTDEEESQVKLLVNLMARNRIEEKMHAKIIYEYKQENKVNANQIGKIVQLFDNAQGFDKDSGIEKIQNYINHLEYRNDGVKRINTDSSSQLKSLRIDNMSAIAYIKQNLSKLDDDDEFYNDYDLYSISINGINPEFTEQQIYEYRMMELENIFRYILMKEGKNNVTKR